MPLAADATNPADESIREADRVAEEAALRAQIDRVQEEKRRALREPGPTWREWWFYSASKWYILLGFLIADVWAATAWVEAGVLLAAVGTVALLLYLEFLLYQYLWFRPEEAAFRRRALFHPSWHRPVPFGRWTPEAHLVRTGRAGTLDEEGPDLGEFV